MLDADAAVPDPDRPPLCPGCGWQGPEMAMPGPGADEPVGGELACPRCGAPVEPDMPTVLDIIAARLTPLPED